MARDIKAITQTQKKLEASMIEYRTVYVEEFQTRPLYTTKIFWWKIFVLYKWLDNVLISFYTTKLRLKICLTAYKIITGCHLFLKFTYIHTRICKKTLLMMVLSKGNRIWLRLHSVISREIYWRVAGGIAMKYLYRNNLINFS